jgi:RNA polymerase sigma-70 factor (ECF subfamily)
MEEKELVERLKKGDDLAYREVIRRYGRKMFGLIFSMTKKRDETEEIMQEVFLKVIKHIKDFREDSLFSTWLFRITVNTTLSYMKKKKRKRESLISELKRDEEERIDFEDKEEKGTDETLETEERRKIVQTAIESLPQSYRIAIILKDIEGMPLTEVAKILKLSEGGTKVRLHRARLMLKKKLQPLVEKGKL